MASPPTVTHALFDTVSSIPDAVALRWRDAGRWGSWTWKEYAQQAARVAAGFRELGVQRGDRILLMTRNRPEFHVADMAAMLIGAVPVSVYTSASSEQLLYTAGHAEARLCVVETPAFLERFLKVRSDLPDLRHLVVVSDPERMAPPDVIPFAQLSEAVAVDVEAAAAAAQPEDMATLIYTSGTTGPPKGVIITHANVVWTVRSLIQLLGHRITGYQVISFLPMAHIAERMITHYAHVHEGTEVTTCPNPGLFPQYLSEVRPRLVFAVPRVWEKAYSTIEAMAASVPDEHARFEAALAVGRRVEVARAAGTAVSGPLAKEFEEADEVLSAVRGLIGLDRCELAVTAAAPIGTEVLVFFRSLGVPLSELYGMSESCGPLTWDPHVVRPGDTGPPIPGCKVRLTPEGEVLAWGGNIFAGYYKDADRTAEALDPEGWLHTGDLGQLEDGRLRIVGRKKDLIVTAGGENVSPSNIETALRSVPLIDQAIVAGDRRPYLVGLLTVDQEALGAWGRQAGLGELALPDLLQRPELQEEMARQVAQVNERFSRAEQVKRFAILDHQWLADSEELTATMKLKRDTVVSKYAAEIDALYG
jgi:long-chain acyl-CoA synthetase